VSDPITRQRSPWELFTVSDFAGFPNQWHRRRVGDGDLTVCVGEEPTGWHLSISFKDHKGRNSRYPRWDEIIEARERFLPDDVEFAMFLPKSEDYVALHATTFHLHEYPGREL